MDSGLYIAVFRLAAAQTIRVGRLGRFEFPAGYYFYVGSGQRRLGARLERHARRRKPLRWHIDYLSTRAEMLGAILLAGDRSAECATAAALAECMARHIEGFGASDCRCGGHLLYSPQWP